MSVCVLHIHSSLYEKGHENRNEKKGIRLFARMITSPISCRNLHLCYFLPRNTQNKIQQQHFNIMYISQTAIFFCTDYGLRYTTTTTTKTKKISPGTYLLFSDIIMCVLVAKFIRARDVQKRNTINTIRINVFDCLSHCVCCVLRSTDHKLI